MKDIRMKTATILALAIAAVTSIPLLAQEVDRSSSANEPAKTTYAPAAGGYGDEAASHAWEMSSVTGELEGKLDSKTAKAGDRVVLKTTDKVQTADGTVIPRGSRLVGHVTEVRAYDKEHGSAQMAIAFDRVELKNGQSIAIYTLIRGVNLSTSAMAASQMNDDGMMGMPVPAGTMANRGRMDNGSYGSIAAANGAGLATSQVDRVSDAATSMSNRADTNPGSTMPAGSGLNTPTGAHSVAVARAIPHPTGIPGVMLAGNSTSSGLLLASRKDIQFESGTEMQLGIVADR